MTTHGRPGGRPSPIADQTHTTVQEAADADRDSGLETLYLGGSGFQRRSGAQCRDHPDQRARPGAASCAGRRAGLRPRGSPDGGAGSADRAYAAGGVRLARLQRGVLRRAGPSTSSGCAIGWQAGVGEAGLDSWEPDLAGKPCPYAAGTRGNRSIRPADFASADACLIVWRPRRFPGCLGVLGIVLSRRCRAAALKGRGGRVVGNEHGALRALRAAVCEGCAVRPITADRAGLARSLGKRARSLRQRPRVSTAPRGRILLRGRSRAIIGCAARV